MFTFSVLLILLPLALGDDSLSSLDDTTEYVKDLDVDEFYKLLDTNRDQITFVRFYLPTCPACEDFYYDWQRIGKTLHEICNVVDYNCEEDPDTCDYIGVEGFPEFGVFYNNRFIAVYDDDDYNYRRLVNFIKKKNYLRSEYLDKVKRRLENS